MVGIPPTEKSSRDKNCISAPDAIRLAHPASTRGWDSIRYYYVGDGWYRDGQSFDYYSCWAFNFYAPLWNLWYGYENEPFLAKKFEEYSNCLMETYPDFFDADGFTNMWGRSCIYRFASTSPFDGNLMLSHPRVDAGCARRIASGALMQ